MANTILSKLSEGIYIIMGEDEISIAEKVTSKKYKTGKICENCLYCDVSLFDEPCVSCLIENNSNWEAMESYD